MMFAWLNDSISKELTIRHWFVLKMQEKFVRGLENQMGV